MKSVEVIRSITLQGAPATIVTGDFNAGPRSRPMGVLLDGGMRDAWQYARHRATPEFSTYAKYRPPRLGTRIDWTTTTANVTVDEIAILARPIDGGWPSDHLPVQAKITLEANKGRQ